MDPFPHDGPRQPLPWWLWALSTIGCVLPVLLLVHAIKLVVLG